MNEQTPLRKHRLSKKWTMSKLAKEARVSLSTLSRYENDWDTPTYQTAQRLAIALEVEVSQIYPNKTLKESGRALI